MRIPNRHCEERSDVAILLSILRLLRQLLCNFLAMTVFNPFDLQKR
ncbi:hypothetical protein RFEPED_0443 [Rickettsia felis str. Pedreira]|uniref:Uncharacterized protein n=1 Tax=Rickettsia felis str. Pedreira TaxID=1359196 RepID=A0A0F3MQZ9_RICFI|nr:hypothetical protein RFEPED_0443 [Rickettsia felis str. Pedreira]